MKKNEPIMVEEKRTPKGLPYKAIVVHALSFKSTTEEDPIVRFTGVVRDLVAQHPREVPLLVDMTLVEQIDSKGLGVLIWFNGQFKKERKKGWWPPLFLLSSEVQELIKYLGVLYHLLTFSNENEFQNDYEKNYADENDNQDTNT